MSRAVLVAMDRSEDSRRALEFAFEEFPGATVFVVHVTESSDPFGVFGGREPETYVVPDCEFDVDDGVMPDGNSFDRAQRERAEQVFETACTLSERYDEPIEPVVRSGNAVDEILACAEARQVDRIVIADHHNTALRPLLRSVPEAVARGAGRPVTVL